MSTVAAIVVLFAVRGSGPPETPPPDRPTRVRAPQNILAGPSKRPLIALDDAPIAHPGGTGGGKAGADPSGHVGDRAGGGGIAVPGRGGSPSGGISIPVADAADTAGKAIATSDDDDPPVETDPESTPATSDRAPIILHHQVYPTDDGGTILPGTAYDIVYQSNDRQSFDSHRIDIEFVLRRLRERHDAGSDAMVMLDYEFEFVEALESDPALPRFQDMLQHLCEVLDQIKAEFPALRVTYYRIPNLPVFPAASNGDITNWASASGSTRERELRRFEAMRPLLDRMDWFAPNLYDWLSNQEMIDRHGERSVAEEQVWRQDLVRTVVEHVRASSRPERPVLPMGCTMWVYRSTRSAPYRDRLIPVSEFLSDQVAPAVAAGADGMSFWNNDLNMVQGAFGLAPGIPTSTVQRYRKALNHRHDGPSFAWDSEIDRTRAHRMLRDQEIERLDAARAALAGD